MEVMLFTEMETQLSRICASLIIACQINFQCQTHNRHMINKWTPVTLLQKLCRDKSYKRYKWCCWSILIENNPRRQTINSQVRKHYFWLCSFVIKIVKLHCLTTRGQKDRRMSSLQEVWVIEGHAVLIWVFWCFFF